MKSKFDLSQEKFLFKRSSGGPLIVLNAFPNTYEVGMASLGYQSVFRIYSSDPQTHCFRYFTDFQEIHPKDFHLMTFSVSWELDFINILKILKDLDIPLRSQDRGPEHPLILAGGPVVTANPEPWSDFFDLIAIGDSENNSNQIIDYSLQYFKSKSVQNRNFEIFTEIPGIYVPSLKNKVERAKASKEQLQMSSIIAPESAWGDTGLLEVVRSCPELCRFCLASYLSLPFRTPDLNTDLIPKAKHLLKYTNNIGLLGASVSQHPEFTDLLEFFVNNPSKPKLQIASMRASTITKEICELLVKADVKNLTIAIESGSERLRSIINKKLPEEYILKAAKEASLAGLKSLKLYGMVGLPHENENDIDLSIELLKKIKKENPQLKIIWGLSVFTPKAQTPFQNYGVDPLSEKKLQKMVKSLRPLGIDVREESFKWAQIQTLISRGDRQIGNYLIEIFKQGDAGANIFKKIVDKSLYKYFVFDTWKEGLYPWDIITTDTQKSMLKKHKEEAENLK